MNKPLCGIYSIQCLVNNKIYIGSSFECHNRFAVHFYSLRKNKHINPHLQNAYNKYGKDKFIHNMVEYCEEDRLEEREDYWIDTFDSKDRKFGYNLKSARNKKHTAETKKKISEAHKGKKLSAEHKEKLRIASIGNTYSLGRKHTKEELEKMSKASLGKHKSESHRKNISKGMLGITFSEEHKNNLSKAQKGKKVSGETKLKMSISAKKSWAKRKEKKQCKS